MCVRLDEGQYARMQKEIGTGRRRDRETVRRILREHADLLAPAAWRIALFGYVRLFLPLFPARQKRPILCTPQHTAVRLAAQRAPSCSCRSHAHLCSALLPEKGAACLRGAADRLKEREV